MYIQVLHTYALYLQRKVYLSKNYTYRATENIFQVKKSLNLNMNDFKNYGINLRNLNINKNIKLSKEIRC